MHLSSVLYNIVTITVSQRYGGKELLLKIRSQKLQLLSVTRFLPRKVFHHYNRSSELQNEAIPAAAPKIIQTCYEVNLQGLSVPDHALLLSPNQWKVWMQGAGQARPGTHAVTPQHQMINTRLAHWSTQLLLQKAPANIACVPRHHTPHFTEIPGMPFRECRHNPLHLQRLKEI